MGTAWRGALEQSGDVRRRARKGVGPPIVGGLRDVPSQLKEWPHNSPQRLVRKLQAKVWQAVIASYLGCQIRRRAVLLIRPLMSEFEGRVGWGA
jgi:hypothetical protein